MADAALGAKLTVLLLLLLLVLLLLNTLLLLLLLDVMGLSNLQLLDFLGQVVDALLGLLQGNLALRNGSLVIGGESTHKNVIVKEGGGRGKKKHENLE